MDETAPDFTPEAAAETCLDVVERVEEAVVVDRQVLYEILSAVIARGHVLIEDVPGTGKTVTARVLAETLGLDFQRIQFTPDLLPADVTGSNVYNEREREFEFAEGPVFTNVVLADEINRAPPKTQAALLETMEERQVSVDGTTRQLPEPFFVVATQNPVEQEGTFQLPEAQRDRFSVKTSFGYPDVEGEMGLLERRANRRTLSPSVSSVIDGRTVRELQALAEAVRVDRKVRRYIVDLARATREDDRVDVGVSPRGVQRVFEGVRASAVISGRDYATPDDVKRLAEAAMAHRLVLTTEATVQNVEPRDVVRDALDAVDVPGVSPDASANGPADGRDARSADGADDRRGADGPTDRSAGEPPTSGQSSADRSDRSEARSERATGPEPNGPDESGGEGPDIPDGSADSGPDVPDGSADR